MKRQPVPGARHREAKGALRVVLYGQVQRRAEHPGEGGALDTDFRHGRADQVRRAVLLLGGGDPRCSSLLASRAPMPIAPCAPTAAKSRGPRPACRLALTASRHRTARFLDSTMYRYRGPRTRAADAGASGSTRARVAPRRLAHMVGRGGGRLAGRERRLRSAPLPRRPRRGGPGPGPLGVASLRARPALFHEGRLLSHETSGPPRPPHRPRMTGADSTKVNWLSLRARHRLSLSESSRT